MLTVIQAAAEAAKEMSRFENLTIVLSVAALVAAAGIGVWQVFLQIGQGRLQAGLVEIEISSQIRGARERIEDFTAQWMHLFTTDRATLTVQQKAQLEIIGQVFKSAREGLLNAYESACRKYNDGKVDKVRFRKDYQDDIRKLMNHDEYKVELNNHASRYFAIKGVFMAWENTEQPK